MIELGFYISLLFSVASDVKRKVSLQMCAPAWAGMVEYGMRSCVPAVRIPYHSFQYIPRSLVFILKTGLHKKCWGLKRWPAKHLSCLWAVKPGTRIKPFGYPVRSTNALLAAAVQQDNFVRAARKSPSGTAACKMTRPSVLLCSELQNKRFTSFLVSVDLHLWSVIGFPVALELLGLKQAMRC